MNVRELTRQDILDAHEVMGEVATWVAYDPSKSDENRLHVARNYYHLSLMVAGTRQPHVLEPVLTDGLTRSGMPPEQAQKAASILLDDLVEPEFWADSFVPDGAPEMQRRQGGWQIDPEDVVMEALKLRG